MLNLSRAGCPGRTVAELYVLKLSELPSNLRRGVSQ